MNINRAYAEWRQALTEADAAHELARRAAAETLQAALNEVGLDFELIGSAR